MHIIWPSIIHMYIYTHIHGRIVCFCGPFSQLPQQRRCWLAEGLFVAGVMAAEVNPPLSLRRASYSLSPLPFYISHLTDAREKRREREREREEEIAREGGRDEEKTRGGVNSALDLPSTHRRNILARVQPRR